MCIAFDGAYILEAPPADPGSTDEHRPVPEIMPASAGGEGASELNPGPTSLPSENSGRQFRPVDIRARAG